MNQLLAALAGVAVLAALAGIFWAKPMLQKFRDVPDIVLREPMPPTIGGGFQVFADPRHTPDDNNIEATIEQLNAAFAAFKDENDQNIKDLKKGQEDVVRSEKIDRIDASITELQAAVDENIARLSALSLGGQTDSADPDVVAHTEAFNEWFRRGGNIEDTLHDLEIRAGLTTQSDPDGGFLVPTEMEATIDRLLGTESAMRQLATVRPMGAATYKKLVNKGGSTSGWVGEEDDRPETDTAKLSGLEFVAKEIYAEPAATQTTLDDAEFDIEGWINDEAIIEFGEQEGAGFIAGDKPTRPRGLLSYDTVADANWEWGKIGFIISGNANAFPATEPADALIDLTTATKTGYLNDAWWLMNRKTVGVIRKFKDANENYLWQPSIAQGQPATLMSYPLATDDNMPDVAANAFPIGFGSFKRGYLILDRKGITVLRDPYTSKPNVKFYMTKRVAGGVQNFQAIKFLKISA